MVPGKPFTRDQLTMLERDNIVADGALGLAALGIVPTPVELIVPDYLDRYRPGGGKRRGNPRLGPNRLLFTSDMGYATRSRQK